MLTRDCKIPIIYKVQDLVDIRSESIEIDTQELRNALMQEEETPVRLNGRDVFLRGKAKYWASNFFLYKDDSIMPALEELYWKTFEDQYWCRPLSFKDFIMNPDYLGTIYGEKMNKFWMDILNNRIHKWTFHKQYCEVVASLAIGTGKTTAADISLSYEIYKLMCLKNPTSFYKNLVRGTKIVFSLFNVSRDLALQVTFDPLRSIFAESPYFKERVVIPGKSSLTEYGIYITEDIRLDLGSLDRNALGKAVFGAVLDEGNFNRIEDQTLKSYSTLRTRITSRFGTTHGFPGILWAVSSPLTDADSINVLINGADPKTTYVLDDIAQWLVWPDPQRYTLHRRFPVFVGDGTRDPKILLKGKETAKNYDKNKIIMVPNNLYNLFQRDVYKNLRDLAGRRVAGSMNLFRSVELLRNVFTAPNPTKSLEPIKLDFYNRDDKLLNHLKEEYFKNPMYPECPRVIHLDEAEADGVNRYGIAATYYRRVDKTISPFRKGIDIWDDDTQAIEMDERFYYCDWAFAIEAKHGQKIPLARIKEWLAWLRGVNYPIGLITGDKPTQATRNDLEQIGFTTEYLSVDRERDPWIAFREEVETQNILLPYYPLAMKEAQHLVDDADKGKIDHLLTNPDGTPGSKDVMDAIVGSYWGVKMSKIISGQMTVDHRALDTNYKRRVAQIKNQILGTRPGQWDIDGEVLMNFIKS